MNIWALNCALFALSAGLLHLANKQMIAAAFAFIGCFFGLFCFGLSFWVGCHG